MPKVNTRTRAEELRHVAGLGSRKPDQAREAWEAFSGEVDTARTAAEAWESAELSTLNEQIGGLADALGELVDLGATIDGMDELRAAAEAMSEAEAHLGVDSDALATFIEAYDELESALDEFDGIKESDRYEGKGDDLETAWGEVTEKLENLAEAADTLGFDFTPTSPEAEAEAQG